MKQVKIFLICFSLLSSSFSFAAQKKEGSDIFLSKAELLEKAIEQFKSMCVDSKGNILESTIVVDREAILNDGEVINCRDEAIRLSKMLDELKLELSKNHGVYSPQVEKCDDLATTLAVSPLDENNTLLVRSSEEISAKAKENQCKAQSGTDCAKDIACNLLRSVYQSRKMLNFIPEKDRPQRPKCVSANESDCATELFKGIIDDLWMNVKGLFYDLPKMMLDGAKGLASGAKNLAVDSWKHLTKVEDKTSNAALAASAQSEGAIKKFMKDPKGFIHEMGMSIWTMITDAAKNNFGCERFEGAPHHSKCLVPLSDWDCASCNQKMNVFCGVAGVVGSEIIVMNFLMATGIALAPSVYAKSAASLAKLNATLLTNFPKLAKAEAFVGKGTALVGGALSSVGDSIASSVAAVGGLSAKGIEYANKVLNSEMSLKILNFAKEKSKPAALALLKLSKTKNMQVTIKVIKGAGTVVGSPVKAYQELINASTEAGKAVAKALVGDSSRKTFAGTQKFSQVMKNNEALGSVDDIVVNTKDLDGISLESTKLKLKKTGVAYEEVVTADGVKAIKIKLSPTCSVKGGGALFIK